MDTKPLLYGLAGFFIGGFIVALAATTFDKPENKEANSNPVSISDTSNDDLVKSLHDKTGDEYDKAFIAHMVDHHEEAVEMAELSADNAKHDEIKQLSNEIIISQQQEISKMLQWQKDWGYTGNDQM